MSRPYRTLHLLVLILPQSTSGSSCTRACVCPEGCSLQVRQKQPPRLGLEASPIARPTDGQPTNQLRHPHVLPATAHASVLALARQHRPSRRGAQLAPPHDDGRWEACRRTARRSYTCHAVGNLGPFKLWRHEAVYERIDRAIGDSKRRAHSTTPVHEGIEALFDD